MKKVVIVFAVILWRMPLLSAQIPNSGFEDTVVVGSLPYAAGWKCDLYGSGVTPDAYSGNFAASVWNWYTYARGYMVSGSGSSNMPTAGSPYTDSGAGSPVSGKPDQLTGFYKYVFGDISAPDSAVIQVTMKKDGSVIGFGEVRLDSVSGYTAFAVDISYTSPDMPDTVIVALISSVGGLCGTESECFYLSVDDLMLVSLSGTTSIQETLNVSSAYPNPSNGELTISHRQLPHGSRLRIYSPQGQIVRDILVPDAAEYSTVDLRGAAAGVLIYRIVDPAGVLLDSGRIVIAE